MNKSQKYFDPKTLASIQGLGLRARTLVEGLVAGLHRSPLRGHSIEFAQHREYVPGDDLRQVDWKVYARSDRYYLKQYEDETNLTCYLLLDHSQSMDYRGAGSDLSKLEYAQLIVCSLAYLIVAQQDSAGLISFSDAIDDWLPASSSPTQFNDMIRLMESSSGRQRTDLASILAQVMQRLSRSSLVILISDMFDDVEKVIQALRMLRSAGHDALVVQVLDHDEVRFPFDQMTQFEGLEGAPSIMADPLMIGQAYRRAMQQFCAKLEAGCRQVDIDYYRLLTNESLALALPRVLGSRAARGI